MQKLKIRSDPPPIFIRLPANMKRGMARSGKLSKPPHILWATAIMGRFPSISKARTDEIIIAQATGTLKAMRTMRLTTITRNIVFTLPIPYSSSIT